MEKKVGMARQLKQNQQKNISMQKYQTSDQWRLKLNEALADRPVDIRKAGSVSPPKLPTVSDFVNYEFFAPKPSFSVYHFKDKFRDPLDQPESTAVNQDRIRRVTRQMIYGQLLNAVESETQHLPA